MIAVFRGGFAKDVIILLVVSLTFGTLLTAGVAGAAGNYMSRAVREAFGGPGEFDVMVHARAELKESARNEIEHILKSKMPGARLREGPTLAGKANFLIAIPERMRTRKTMEDLPRIFEAVPGGSGYTVMLEPRVFVSEVDEGSMDVLMPEIGKIRGVKFSFKDHGGISVALESFADIPRISGEIKALLAQYQVVEVRLPPGLGAGVQGAQSLRRIEASLISRLERELPGGFMSDITGSSNQEDPDDMVTTMGELKRFLSYYENNKARLEHALDESLRLSMEVQALRGNAYEGSRKVQEWLTNYEGVIGSLIRAQRMLEKARNNGVGNGVPELLEAADGILMELQAMDVDAMRRDLARASEGLDSMGKADTGSIVGEVKGVRDSLPDLKEADITRSINLIDRYIDSQSAYPEKIRILVGTVASLQGLKVLVRGVLTEVIGGAFSGSSKWASGKWADKAVVIVTPAGALEPNLRGEVFRILREARGVIAGIVAILFTILTLLMDHSGIIAFLRRVQRHSASWLYGTTAGSFILGFLFASTHAQLPLVGPWHVVGLGAVLGRAVSCLAERVSPVNEDEVTAGEALGLSYCSIMREIVIPSGRPGLLNLLNRRRLRFRTQSEAM